MTADRIRPLQPDDATLILTLMDAAIEWFVEIGNEGQWGSTPFSSRPDAQERARAWCDAEGWVLERQGDPVAVIALGEPVEYAPAITESELYIRLLLGSRRARGAGARLLAHATEPASAAGVNLLRVDCYAGGTGALVSYYENQGFVKTDAVDVKGWPGQILSKPLTA